MNNVIINKIWQTFKLSATKNLLPQAILLIVPNYLKIIDYCPTITSILLCPNNNAPCKACTSCHLTTKCIHPDVQYIRPEAKHEVIKIEQIRNLQKNIFHLPALNNKKIIIIHPAEKMNLAAANCLLKILEEPPSQVIFLLITQQPHMIIPTILSRCQRWNFNDNTLIYDNYLELGQQYADTEDKHKIFAELLNFIKDLNSLTKQKISISILANKWLSFKFIDVLWFLYLITAEMITCKLQLIKPQQEDLSPLMQKYSLDLLFTQLDKIIEFNKKLPYNLNPQLALETLLIGYLEL